MKKIIAMIVVLGLVLSAYVCSLSNSSPLDNSILVAEGETDYTQSKELRGDAGFYYMKSI